MVPKVCVVLSLSLFLSGCVATYNPPTGVAKRYVYDFRDVSFDDVWESVVGTYAEFNIPIELIQKESGLISADALTFRRGKHADCGRVVSNGSMVSVSATVVEFNTFVRDMDDGRIRVHVNASYSANYSFYDPIWGTRGEGDMYCVSNGSLENALLSQIFRSVAEQYHQNSKPNPYTPRISPNPEMDFGDLISRGDSRRIPETS